jgi:hypothetical protein
LFFEDWPEIIFKLVFGTLQISEIVSNNSAFALPSTGGDFNLNIKQSVLGTMPAFEQPGFTLTNNRLPPAAAFTKALAMSRPPAFPL